MHYLHLPLAHLPAQTLPQVPQFALSTLTLTQVPGSPHCMDPPAQAHAPSEQTSPLAHWMPHPPQLARLALVLVHCGGVPHASVFAGQLHWPPLQTVPAEQTMPQPPQLPLSA